MPETVALIVAAGRGARLGGDIPKQYQVLAGKPVLRWAVEAFLTHGGIDAVQLVVHDDDRDQCATALAGLALEPPAYGGAGRQDSVRNGLEALSKRKPARVLIHDGARPLVSREL